MISYWNQLLDPQLKHAACLSPLDIFPVEFACIKKFEFAKLLSKREPELLESCTANGEFGYSDKTILSLRSNTVWSVPAATAVEVRFPMWRSIDEGVAGNH